MKNFFKLLRIYRYQLTITFSLFGVFFVFQNGSCGSGDVADGSTTSSSTTSTTITSTLAITPSTTSVVLGGSVLFSATGGTLPYTYTSLSGTGTFSGGLFYAPSTAGTIGIEVHDSSSPVQYSYASLVISTSAVTTNTIVVSPNTETVGTSSSFQFSATGGTAPYNYVHTSGAGSLSSTGYFIAPASAASDVITVTDSLGFMSQVTITTSASVATSTVSSNVRIGSVSTNSQLAGGWPVSNLITNTTPSNNGSSNCYSSTEYTAATQSTPPNVMVNIYDSSISTTTAATVDHINLHARLGTNSSFVTYASAFPTSYNISWMNSAGVYTSLGTFTAQPDLTTGIDVITFSAVYTKRLVIVANTMGKDGSGNFYFQMCGLSF
jgi:hypothetical protein